jgi:hypothetical protein
MDSGGWLSIYCAAGPKKMGPEPCENLVKNSSSDIELSLDERLKIQQSY